MWCSSIRVAHRRTKPISAPLVTCLERYLDYCIQISKKNTYQNCSYQLPIHSVICVICLLLGNLDNIRVMSEWMVLACFNASSSPKQRGMGWSHTYMLTGNLAILIPCAQLIQSCLCFFCRSLLRRERSSYDGIILSIVKERRCFFFLPPETDGACTAFRFRNGRCWPFQLFPMSREQDVAAGHSSLDPRSFLWMEFSLGQLRS